MFIELLQGKIHRAVVTECRLDYEGSLTVDIELIEAVGLTVYQKIQVLNVTNGSRIETYLIPGDRGKREVMVNGAAARLMHKGDLVIICGFGNYTPEEATQHRPQIVVLDSKNQITERH